MELSPTLQKRLATIQRGEITGHDHRRFQLLHRGGPGREFPPALHRNGRGKPGRGFVQFRDRVCDSPMAGGGGLECPVWFSEDSKVADLQKLKDQLAIIIRYLLEKSGVVDSQSVETV